MKREKIEQWKYMEMEKENYDLHHLELFPSSNLASTNPIVSINITKKS